MNYVNKYSQYMMCMYKAIFAVIIAAIILATTLLVTANTNLDSYSYIENIIMFMSTASVITVAVIAFVRFWRKDIFILRNGLLGLATVASVGLGFVTWFVTKLLLGAIQQGFKGLVFNFWGVLGVLSLFVVVFSYYTAEFVYDFSQKKFVNLTFMVFILGFFYAASVNADANWWHDSVCALGMSINQSPIYYNLTITITGLMLFSLIYFFRQQISRLLDLGVIEKEAPFVYLILYIIFVLNIFIIGLIPYGISETLNEVHIFFANYTFVHIGVVMVFARWLFKWLPPAIMKINYLMLFLVVCFYYLVLRFPILPYAIIELLVMAMAVLWLVMLAKTIKLMSDAGASLSS